MRFLSTLLALASCGSQAPQPDAPRIREAAAVAPAYLEESGAEKLRLVRIWFNPYADSIKPVLNYYIAVDGEFSDGSFLPMDSSYINLTADHGTLAGNEWVLPKTIDFDRVTFRAEGRNNPALRDSITLWIKKSRDQRDAPDYSGEE